MADYYVILGVSRSADLSAIRKAFKDIARKHHPDRNPGNAEAERIFKAASAAYAVLADNKKRALYDEFGEEGLAVGFNVERARARRAASQGRAAYGGGISFNDILSGRYSPKDIPDPEPPKDRSQGPFYDHKPRSQGPYYGTPPQRPAGGGYTPPPRPTPPPPPRAPTHGGRVRAQTQPAAQPLRTSVTVDPMTALQGGETRVQFMRPTRVGGLEEVTLRVTIPANTRDGASMRLRGQGGYGRGASGPQDVLLEIRVDRAGPVRQDGRNIELEVPVTLGEALLGGKIEVESPMGRFQVLIPSGSDTGTRIRVRGRGAPGLGSSPPGDLVLVIKPMMPDQISEDMLELVRKLEQYYTRSPRESSED